MLIIVLLCLVVLVLHHGITQRFPTKHPQDTAAEIASSQAVTGSSGERTAGGAVSTGGNASFPRSGSAVSDSSEKQHLPADHKPSVSESLRFLARSPQIQCLGIMSLSQGLTTNLLDLAWKTHLHMLHPSPAASAV